MMGEGIHLQNEQTLSMLDSIRQSFSAAISDPSALNAVSYAQLNQHIRIQAFAMSYNDAFLLIFFILFIASACVWIFPYSKAMH